MKRTTFPFAAFFTALMLPSWLFSAPQMTLVGLAPSTIRCYEKYSCTLTVAGKFSNPFDSSDVALDATITGTEGGSFKVPLFYLSGTPEKSIWELRTTVFEKGNYHITIKARDREGESTLTVKDFTAEPPTTPGFLCINPKSPYTFKFNNGTEFRGIGENISGIGEKAGSAASQNATAAGDPYGYFFQRLSPNGANFIRKWIALPQRVAGAPEYLNWPGGAWWDKKVQAEFKHHGPGRLDLKVLTEIDTMFDSAEREGIYIMLCLQTGHTFQSLGWSINPYNSANGGPCIKTEDFITNREAIRWTKEKYRYLIARYGYRTHLAMWEFWNELEIGCGGSLKDWVAWHKEMGEFMRAEDPYRHMLSTSFSSSTDAPDLWSLPQLDVIQVHTYESVDAGSLMYARTGSFYINYHKPAVFGEFGIGEGDFLKYDPRWRHLDEGLWQTLFAPTPILALNWFRNEIDLTDAYNHFKPVAEFSRNLMQNPGEINGSTLPSIPVKSAGSPAVRTVRIFPGNFWLRDEWMKTPKLSVSLAANGDIISNEMPMQLKPKLPLEVKAKFRSGGGFSITPKLLHGTAKEVTLSLALDGTHLASKVYTPGKASSQPLYVPERGTYEPFSVSIPEGEHKLLLEVKPTSGSAWFNFIDLQLNGAGDPGNERVTPYCLTKGNVTACWFKRSGVTWYEMAEKGMTNQEPAACTGVKAEIPVPGPGAYSVSWFNTQTGAEISNKIITTVTGSDLHVLLPDFKYSIAVLIKPQPRNK